jgi:hypothetical protein
MIFCLMTPRILVDGYQHFAETWYLHLQQLLYKVLKKFLAHEIPAFCSNCFNVTLTSEFPTTVVWCN